MEKEFIPYNEALALKELGFDEPCIAFYSTEKELHPVMQQPAKGPYFNNGSFIETIRAALYQQAFRWFREKYGLVVGWSHEKNYHVGSYIGICVKNIHHKEPIFGIYETHEEAELDCLKKLISIVKNK